MSELPVDNRKHGDFSVPLGWYHVWEWALHLEFIFNHGRVLVCGRERSPAWQNLRGIIGTLPVKTRGWRAEFFPSALWLNYAIRRRPVGSVQAPCPSGSLFETLTCGPRSNAKISGCTRPRHLADKPLLDPVSGLWSEHKPITFDQFALDYAFASRDDARLAS